MTGEETSESRKFAIIGVAGYIAPRHLNAMRSLGCDLVAAHDVFDSVGMIDGYFPVPISPPIRMISESAWSPTVRNF